MAVQQPESKLWQMVIAYDQWKEEHAQLYERLLELCRFMRWNPGNYEYHDWSAHHQLVREKFLPFMAAWQRHLLIEQSMIYPLTRSKLGGGRIGTAGVLEEDSRIASQYYDAYVKAVEDGVSPEEALSHLLQVLIIVAEHFRIEDETLVPAAEQLMDEIEYSGS